MVCVATSILLFYPLPLHLTYSVPSQVPEVAGLPPAENSRRVVVSQNIFIQVVKRDCIKRFFVFED